MRAGTGIKRRWHQPADCLHQSVIGRAWTCAAEDVNSGPVAHRDRHQARWAAAGHDHVDLDHWQPEPFRCAGVGRPQSLCPSTPSLRPVHYVCGLRDRRHSQMSDTQPSTTFLPPLSQEHMPYVNAVRAYASRTSSGSTSQATQVRRPPSRSCPTCLASRYWRSTSHHWWTALIRVPFPPLCNSRPNSPRRPGEPTAPGCSRTAHRRATWSPASRCVMSGS